VIIPGQFSSVLKGGENHVEEIKLMDNCYHDSAVKQGDNVIFKTARMYSGKLTKNSRR
jgi:hypothetical protein